MKMKHNNKGFSLVELIVVIAIMAILGGVGTAGYTKYIAHANKNADLTTVGNVMRVLDTNTLAINADLPEQISSEGIQFPIGFVVLSNEEMTDDDGNTGTAIVLQNDKTTLVDSIEAGFGENYSNSLKLKSNIWSGASFPTFFNKGEEMVGKVNTLGTGLVKILGSIGASNGTLTLGSTSLKITEEGHDNAADLFLDFADKAVQKNNTTKDAETKKNEFLTNWNNAKDSTYNGYGFGLTGREYYSAARAAYNSSFASYVEEQGTSPNDLPNEIEGSHDFEKHAELISGFGIKAGTAIRQEGEEKISSLNWFLQGAANLALGIAESTINNGRDTKDMIFPYTVCDNAFTDTSAGFEFQNCPICKALYEKYTDSGACSENGAAFYDTMLTASSAGRDKLADMTSDEFFAWMSDQTKAFSEMYNNVQTLTTGKSSIVITIHSKDGLLTYDVMPAEANPRTTTE